MSKTKIKNEFYTQKENRIIYVLLSPTEKFFYINHCLKSSIKETYRHNFKGRRTSSKYFIEKISPQRPCIFILENIYTTKSDAYNHLLIWIKVFIENGYKSFNNQKSIARAERLNFYNSTLYEKKRNENLEEFLSCKNCYLPTYKNIVCKKYTNEMNGEKCENENE